MSRRYEVEIDEDYDHKTHDIFEKKLELLCLEYNAIIKHIWNE